jgi:predicted secreted hydrolase
MMRGANRFGGVMWGAVMIGALMTGALMAGLVPPCAAAEFARADRPREWSFPRDHGSHPSYATEWWYFTGSLRDEDGDHLGFELTFFRVALRPDSVASSSAWRARDLIIGHLAVTDVAGGRFHHDERVQRAAAGLAGAEVERFDVWIGDWRASQDGSVFRLRVESEQIELDLVLDPAKPPVLHGERGLSAKSQDGTAASHYYSMPRLRTRGRLAVAGRSSSVEGTTWMDHEFFTGSTPTDGLGWDWFSARLQDGRDLMLYRVRHPDGSTYRFGTLIEADGSSRVLDLTGLRLVPRETWTSEESLSRYPIAWRIEIPREKATIEVEALLPNQEIVATRSVGFAYWEGLSRYAGTWNEQPVSGEGYVELTGYAPAIDDDQ